MCVLTEAVHRGGYVADCPKSAVFGRNGTQSHAEKKNLCLFRPAAILFCSVGSSTDIITRQLFIYL